MDQRHLLFIKRGVINIGIYCMFLYLGQHGNISNLTFECQNMIYPTNYLIFHICLKVDPIAVLIVAHFKLDLTLNL